MPSLFSLCWRTGISSGHLLAPSFSSVGFLPPVSSSRQDRLAILEKNERKPWLKKQWCTPAATDEFVWRMEDVLDVSCRPYDPHRPLICMDEMGKTLVKDKHAPEAMKPGQPRRED